METRAGGLSRNGASFSDRDMVVAFKGGDARAYAAIYREYRPVAESICHRILQNADDAQEAAQETMLRVFQGLPRFNGRYLLRAWVARIATNVCLDMIRSRQRRPDTSAGDRVINDEREVIRLEPKVETLGDPVEVVVQLEESDLVHRTLTALPSHHRAALEMREFEGMSHEQIGHALGMTAPQVKALLHRAKGSFKRSWTDGKAMSFALPVLLWPARMVRRLFSFGREASTSAATAAASVAQAPAVAPTVSAFAERFGAAAAAVVVAGGIGVGAAALPHHHVHNVKPPKVTVAIEDKNVDGAMHVAAAPAAATAPKPAGSAASRPVARPAHSRRSVPSQSPSPSPSPTTEATPAPSASPSPSPATVPAYSMSFTSGLHPPTHCGCDAKGYLTGSQGTTGTPGKSMQFGQSARGAILDADSVAAYATTLDYSGSVSGDTGNLSVEFRVTRGTDVFTYTAHLSLQSHRAADGSWSYAFSGTYQFSAGPSGSDEPLPRSGNLGATLTFWSDGTLYRAAFAL